MSASHGPLKPFEFPEVRVLEASAGSGKTYALAKRYVQLLLLNARSGDPTLQPPFRSILAITFTNKAAIEMKERILKFLKQLVFDEMPPDERNGILGPLGMSPEDAKRLAAASMEAMIRHYNYFQVQTIDKFINALLVSCAFDIGLTANFRIKTSSREHLALALDELIDEASTSLAARQAFDDFLNSFLLLEARSHWMPKEVILDTIHGLFGVYNTHAREFLRGEVRPEDIIKVKAKVLTDMRAFKEDMPLLHKGFVGSLDRFLEGHKHAFRFNEKLSSYFEKEELPTVKASIVTAAQEDRWQHIHRGLQKAAGLEVAHLYDPYLVLFTLTRAKLVAACTREDIVFLEELNTKARLLFDGGITAPELYYRLSVRFRHYLFDEFQDTSVLQWKNLSLLPEEALATGGTLFYVGDKKQAIFTFRGGEAKLFDQLKEDYQDYNVRTEYLLQNRRSCRHIVEFNNHIFDIQNLERFMAIQDDKGKGLVPARAEDLDQLRSVFGNSHQKVAVDGPSGCVRLEYIEGGKKEDRLEIARERVVKLVKDLRQRFEWRDIAVLVRANSEVEEVTGWLLADGIPVSSERTLDVRDHLLVREVVAFLKFLDTPIDNLSFAEFILGDIFTKASGLSRDKVQDMILGWRKARREHLYVEFREAFPEAWALCVEDFFKNVGLYPVYELIVSFYRRTNVLANFSESQGFLMHFLKIVKDAEAEFPDISSFLLQYEQMEGEALFVSVPEDNAVRITTVHKSKGLEFRVVILPFLTLGVKAGVARGKKTQAYTLRDTHDGMRLYYFNERHTRYSTLAEELKVDEHMRSFFAELNSVYVALTRAECEMYAFVPSKAGSGQNLIRHLIPEKYFALGEPGDYPPARKRGQGVKAVEVPAPACRDWVAFLNEEFMAEGELVGRTERRDGDVYHALLAQVKDVSEESVNEALKTAPSEEVRQVIRDLLAEKSVQRFFDVKDGKVFTEFEIVDQKGRAHRIDRLIISDKAVVVVDYKSTAAKKDKGVAQVREYIRFLQEIYPVKKVEGHLIFIKERMTEEVRS